MGERQGETTYGEPKNYDYEIANLARMVHSLTVRLDALTPAASVPEPVQAPETPEALAIRLLADPAALAAVISRVALKLDAPDRAALHDELQKLLDMASAASPAFRLLGATIAAASFRK